MSVFIMMQCFQCSTLVASSVCQGAAKALCHKKIYLSAEELAGVMCHCNLQHLAFVSTGQLLNLL